MRTAFLIQSIHYTLSRLTVLLPRRNLALRRLAFRLSVPDISLAKAEPAGSRHLLLCEKLDTFFTLHVKVAEEGVVPTVEGEPGHRSRHTDVDANHAALNAVPELA